MILEYHRPTTLEEALALLRRPQPVTVPLAGGSALDHHALQQFAVVDLQALGLNTTMQLGNFLELGASLTLQGLLDYLKRANFPSKAWSLTLIKAISHEATHNLRQVASVAGTLVVADGCSPFATVLLALDAVLTIQPGDEKIELGNFLPLRREILAGRLITQVSIPLNVHLAYEYVARTPADRPVVCAAVSTWPSGRTRVALGGFGSAPVMAFDGTESNGVQAAAQSAYSLAGDDQASAEYRREMAGILVERCMRNE